MRNLSQRPTEASSRPVTPDRRKVGLEVSSIDSVTLSEGEVGRTRTLPTIWSALPMSSEPPHATQIGLIWARAACRSAGESASVAGERQQRRAWMLARADVRCGAGLGPWPAMSPESGEHRRGGRADGEGRRRSAAPSANVTIARAAWRGDRGSRPGAATGRPARRASGTSPAVRRRRRSTGPSGP